MDFGFDNWERACQPLPEQYDPNALTVLRGLDNAQRRAVEIMGGNAFDLHDTQEREAASP